MLFPSHRKGFGWEGGRGGGGEKAQVKSYRVAGYSVVFSCRIILSYSDSLCSFYEIEREQGAACLLA